jgi:transcriptional regulator with XRE-family HTH domain
VKGVFLMVSESSAVEYVDSVDESDDVVDTGTDCMGEECVYNLNETVRVSKIVEVSRTATVKKKNYTMNANDNYKVSDLIDTPIYDEKLMDSVYSGIAQNIYMEMYKQGMSIRGLAELSCVNYSNLTKIFSNKARVGLSSLIKIAAALRVSPADLFPYSSNKRKTNGQLFDELTKPMDIKSINYLLDMTAGYAKIYQQNKN